MLIHIQMDKMLNISRIYIPKCPQTKKQNRKVKTRKPKRDINANKGGNIDELNIWSTNL